MTNFNPFTSDLSDQVQSVSETELIQKIRLWLKEVCPPFPEGIGDDCAVTKLDSGSKYLLTTIDGVGWKKHIDETVSPEDAGRKLLARNLSDIASMGGIPKRAVISLWLSPVTSIQWLQQFYEGVEKLAQEFDVEVIGGDISSAGDDVFIADLCLQGETNTPLLRKQSETGDTIWVTGKLGGSILGKHCAFTPRLKEGTWISENNWAKSMMDISDGLGKDLPALIGNYEVEISNIPVSEAAQNLSVKSQRSAKHHAWNDGEDYELLFTIDKTKDLQSFITEWKEQFNTPVTQIGTIRMPCSSFSARNPDGTVIELGSGYEHF